jgi:predicted  nucleic acid-binding Zn-ribbon protein
MSGDLEKGGEENDGGPIVALLESRLRDLEERIKATRGSILLARENLRGLDKELVALERVIELEEAKVHAE